MGDNTTIQTAILLATSAEVYGHGADVLGKRFAGEHVIDRQLTQLREMGHERVIFFADPSDSDARQIWSVRRNGPIDLIFATSGSDLASAVDGQDLITVVAHGTLWQNDLMAAALKHAPLLATHENEDERSGFERIDAKSHWSGLAVLPTQMVVSVARNLGEWDFQSTLLRKAVQSGTPRMPTPAELVGSALDNGEVDRFVAMRFATIADTDDQILTPPSRSLLTPLARKISERMDDPVLWLGIGGGLFALIALGLSWFFPGPWAFAPLLVTAPCLFLRQLLIKLSGRKPHVGALSIYGLLAVVAALLALRTILPDARPAGLFVFTMALATTASAALFSRARPSFPVWWRVDSMILTLIVLSAIVGILRSFALFSMVSLAALFLSEQASLRFRDLRKS